MSFLKRFISLFLVAGGFALTSQGPEFAQQYRQRLGGAVEELKTVVRDLEKDASAVNKSRQEAIDGMLESTDTYIKARGESMLRTVNRYERLTDQQIQLMTSAPAWRPLVVFRSMDQKIANDAYGAFEPAVPLTVSGLFWGLIGGFCGWVLVALGRLPRRVRKDDTPQPSGTDIAAPQIIQE
ncbi:MAG: DUF2937 family protein [Pseudomonadota bacterium]